MSQTSALNRLLVRFLICFVAPLILYAVAILIVKDIFGISWFFAAALTLITALVVILFLACSISPHRKRSLKRSHP